MKFRPRHQRILEDEEGYKVEKELGSGLFGAVFLATTPDGKKVAIKILSETGVSNQAIKREIRNYELVQMARKKNKFIAKHFPKVFKTFEKAGYIFIVMELLKNKGPKMNLIRDIFQGREGLDVAKMMMLILDFKEGLEKFLLIMTVEKQLLTVDIYSKKNLMIILVC
jgi:serine/threonine protein kinase